MENLQQAYSIGFDGVIKLGALYFRKKEADIEFKYSGVCNIRVVYQKKLGIGVTKRHYAPKNIGDTQALTSDLIQKMLEVDFAKKGLRIVDVDNRGPLFGRFIFK